VQIRVNSAADAGAAPTLHLLHLRIVTVPTTHFLREQEQERPRAVVVALVLVMAMLLNVGNVNYSIANWVLSRG